MNIKKCTTILISAVMTAVFLSSFSYAENGSVKKSGQADNSNEKKLPVLKTEEHGLTLSFEQSLVYLKKNSALLAGKNEIEQRVH